jgi:hypothetical protein
MEKKSPGNASRFLGAGLLLAVLVSSPVLPCVHHGCSNDVDKPGAQDDASVVLGDERLVWQPFVGYVMRACTGTSFSDRAPTTSDGEQGYAEFVGVDYACFGSENGKRCENACYAGAPKMFRAIPDCSNPY